MYRHLFVTFILVIAINLCANAQMKFECDNFQDALKKAKVENKKIFIDCYTTWCGPCKMLAAKVFTDSLVGLYMNNGYVNFKSDMEKGEGIELKGKFKVNAFPTLLILDSDGNEINRLVGATEDPRAFILSIKMASDVSNSIEELRIRYEANIACADDYLKAIGKRGIPDETNSVMKEIFIKRIPEERYSESSFSIYDKLIKYIDQETALMIIADRENAIKYLGEDRFRSFIDSKVTEKIISLYMGDIKKGVNLDECVIFEKFAKEYSDILNLRMYKYFVDTYKSITGKEIDRFLKTSLSYYKTATKAERNNIQKFAYRISVTSGKKASLIGFYGKCKEYLTDEISIKEMDEAIGRIK